MAFLGNDKFSTFLTAQWNFSPADTTMSVNSVPPNLPTIITAGFDTPQETVFSVTGSSGGNTLTGVTKLRGASVDLPQGTVVEVLDNEEFWNQYASAIFTQVGIKSLLYGVDGGSTDAYAITLLVAPTSYSDITGVPIFFKANTVNTGASTLNVNSLGAKEIKTPQGSDLADEQIPAGAVVLVVYDGTYFVLQTQTLDVVGGGSWTDESAVWTRTGDFTFTIPTDVTAIYTKGTKVRYKDGGSYEYGYVESSAFSSVTTITLVTNADYAMAAATITEPGYSYEENPPGFPEWFSFTTTWSGFSANPGTTTVYFKLGGKMCSFYIPDGSNGTSSATSVTFTLPVATARNNSMAGLISIVDNGAVSTTPGHFVSSASSKTLTAYKSFSQAAWTNSGGKNIFVPVTSYEWD